MTNQQRVKAAQTRAKKIIDRYEKLGWEIKPSVKERANMEVPKNITTKHAQAIIDNLSAQTIRVTRSMKTRVTMEETDPIVTGQYKSGARKYDVLHMNEPDVIRKDVEFSERDIVKRVMDQIKFVMNNAPSAQVAEEIETKLFAIELHGTKIFTTDDRKKRQASLLPSIIDEKAIEKSIKEAEKNGYAANEAMVSLYQDLVSEFGTNERGLAARQMRKFQNVLESVGAEYSTDKAERQIASDVLQWLIEHDDLWQEYRRKFKLKKIHHQVYDSSSMLNDVSDAIVDHPKYKMQILEHLIDMMNNMVDPWDIVDEMEGFVKKLMEDEE